MPPAGVTTPEIFQTITVIISVTVKTGEGEDKREAQVEKTEKGVDHKVL